MGRVDSGSVWGSLLHLKGVDRCHNTKPMQRKLLALKLTPGQKEPPVRKTTNKLLQQQLEAHDWPIKRGHHARTILTIPTTYNYRSASHYSQSRATLETLWESAWIHSDISNS